jgi:putative FmdB family regulatory protein
MPTYEYECQKCHHRFEQFQSIKDKPIERCPKCKKGRTKRLFGTGAGIIFKGSGFYQTDYRSKSYSEAASKEKSASSSSSSAKSEGTKSSTTKDTKKAS